MSFISSGDEGDTRRRRRLHAAVLRALREMNIQVSLLNHRVGARVELNDIDLDCLDLIARHGPLSPSALARRAGLHPATITGILDRLERGGWVARERDPADRRAVRVRLLGERMGALMRQYGGMIAAMDRLCDEYSEAELEVLAGFLKRTADAGRDETARLGEE